MTDWKKRATSLAELHFRAAARHGFDTLDGEDACYIFNAQFYKGAAILRDKQLAWFRKQFAQIGVVELGYGEYPKQGISEGSIFVIILQASTEQEASILDLYEQSLKMFWDEESAA